jgi:ribosomal protein S18 acetylase RimI-like enzyme
LTVALVVTGAVAHEIDGLRRALGAAALERIAPHCTLVPPVNVREEHLATVLEHVRAAASTSAPIAVTLGPPSTFWPKTPVLYLAVGGDLEAIAALQTDLATGPLAPPPARTERDFVPHVTLDQRIDPSRLPEALDAMADYRTHHCFERVSILEQDAGNRWRPLADAALGEPSIAGRGSLELEISVVERADPAIAAWAGEHWAQYSRDSYGESVRPIDPFAIVARARGQPVAFAEGEIRGPVLRLSRAIVSPEWRSQGVGSHLLRALERLGVERGCARIRLETRAGGRAQHFYAERGFAVTATLPRWREDRDFVLMERALHIPTPAPPDPAAPASASAPEK